MELTSIIAIYVLFWVLSAFIVLPFGVRRNDELGLDFIEGQDRGAPGNFKPGKVLMITTLVATISFALFYANYVNQWITTDAIDVFAR
ncbi:hypothetical protein MNBD_ALPHA04-1818 [hydrothermal vent metagenome]|uniref:DUF1467 domain-containing protein n=1 Tax=hydrothermal vent metagenome TaxID=652676 RepID=A0A3B0S6E5_9ZZZZ